MTNQPSSKQPTSAKPSKQRNYRDNAPLHVKDTFLNARLADGLQEEHEAKRLRVRIGDTVRVERGDHAGTEGEVLDIDRDRERLHVEGAEQEKIDGSAANYPIHPSNVTITALDDEDETR